MDEPGSNRTRTDDLVDPMPFPAAIIVYPLLLLHGDCMVGAP
jgi:hypothetical protein